MAAPLIPTQYASLHSGYYRCAQLPQPPPSPPVEDSRCSLPSISKLLGLADAGSPSAEPSSASHSDSSRPLSAAARSGQQPPLDSPYIYADSRPGSSYAKPTPQQRGGMPPTPPMGTDTSFDGYHSPPSKPISQFSSSSAPARYYEPTPPLDADSRRHVSSTNTSRPPLQVPSSRHSISSASFSSQSSGGSSYQSLPPAASLHPQISNLFYQQPLPQSFPPLPVPMVLGPATGANPWQHHHYLTPSHGAAFPQNQDRYICQTCNKAFSRPSSLRIHSHSHTGEKPFKCPHSGCGKAFSVRSNMKRHERGCHSFGVGTTRAAKAS